MHLEVSVRVLGSTYIVSFNVWYGQLLGNKLSNSGFATPCWPGDNPHMAVVGGGQGSMNLLDRGSGCVIHGRRRDG